MTDKAKTEPFHPSLTRKLLQVHLDASATSSNKRITSEALVAAGEVLRRFVQEAMHRAGIEAECDHESCVRDVHEHKEGAVETAIPIRADHITKIAADLLMDFS